MKRLIALALAMMMIASSALAWGEKSGAELYGEAETLLKQGKYDEAAEAFSALGNYQDASQLAMYCAAMASGEAGEYAMAVNNLLSLGAFRDAALLARYYAALSYEAAEEFEEAAERFKGLELYRDAAARLKTYPEKILARDYAAADQAEQSGDLDAAYKGFAALGDYRDSAARAAALAEKIKAQAAEEAEAKRAAAYDAADRAEQSGDLDAAYKGFAALGDYRDSAARAAALAEKIKAQTAEAAEAKRAAAYDAADRAEREGDYATALKGFETLGDYRDSITRAAAVKQPVDYAKALQDIQNGKFARAYAAFTALGDYRDSAEKAYVLGVTQFASRINDLGGGVATFNFHGLWGVANAQENVVSSPYWDSIGHLNQFGLARVEKDDCYGYVNARGEVVVPCEWAHVSDFSTDGFCTVARRTTEKNAKNANSPFVYYKFGVMDRHGGQVLAAVWQRVGDSYDQSWGSARDNSYRCNIATPAFSEGKLRVQAADDAYGFVDTAGQPVGDIRWAGIGDFSEGLAWVKEKGQPLYGFINDQGQVVIPPQYAAVSGFSEGLAAVLTTTLTGYQYIDKQNNVVIPALFFKAGSFQNGLADVYSNDLGWLVIDKQGELVYFRNDQTVAAYAQARGSFSPAATATPAPTPTVKNANTPAAQAQTKPTPRPTVKPNAKPTPRPTVKPNAKPTVVPKTQPAAVNTTPPTAAPTAQPAVNAMQQAAMLLETLPEPESYDEWLEMLHLLCIACDMDEQAILQDGGWQHLFAAGDVLTKDATVAILMEMGYLREEDFSRMKQMTLTGGEA